MNVIAQVQAWLREASGSSQGPRFTYSRGPREANGVPAPRIYPALCPQCGSPDAGEETDRARTMATLTCPDCGLIRRTELLSSDELPLSLRKLL